MQCMYILGIAILAKNNTDCVVTLCCEKRRHVSGTTCLVCVMALLLDGDFTSHRQKKPHNIEKRTLVRLCSFFKMKKPVQAPSKSREHYKITVWISSGLSEVVAVAG